MCKWSEAQTIFSVRSPHYYYYTHSKGPKRRQNEKRFREMKSEECRLWFLGRLEFSFPKPNRQNRQNKIETINGCWPVCDTDRRQSLVSSFAHCSLRSVDPIRALSRFPFFFARIPKCANLWDHRENDFASFSMSFSNHRSRRPQTRAPAKTKHIWWSVDKRPRNER